MRITIDSLAYGDSGIGRDDQGKVIFVPGSVPGDVVNVHPTRQNASFSQGVIDKIIQPSADRVQPACPHALTCGGCPWMHISYEAQIRAKRANVVSQLQRIAKVDPERAEHLVGECRPSKRTLKYRNKLELACEHDANHKLTLGFHQREGNLVPIEKQCMVGAPGIEQAPKALRGALGYVEGDSDLGIYRIGLRHSVRTNDTEVALWTPPSPFPRKIIVDTLRQNFKCSSIVRVIADPGRTRKVKRVEVLYGKGCWQEQLCGNSYRISAPSFFQINTAQAETMIELVIKGLGISEDSDVADLYCGAGTFTLPLAQKGAHVYAVESASSSVRDLRRNIEGLALNIEVIGGDSARELPGLGRLDAIVVDPPRAGLAKNIIKSIAASKAQRIAYVSCDPATWARDIARLSEVGYELVEATPVDLFPQTYHVETVSILQRT